MDLQIFVEHYRRKAGQFETFWDRWHKRDPKKFPILQTEAEWKKSFDLWYSHQPAPQETSK